MIEKQELHCHECQRYVQFELDMELNGNHVLNCPNCGHEHCRVVKDGKITRERWDQRNGIVLVSTTVTSSSTASTWDMAVTAGTGDTFTYGAWMNTTTS